MFLLRLPWLQNFAFSSADSTFPTASHMSLGGQLISVFAVAVVSSSVAELAVVRLSVAELEHSLTT